ncbi:hypothetical protein NOM01_04635 [Sporolactobacillus sp. STSJ-5]|uniref:hypothetical protein n=1 Tax=Sporolactobacillus sp. STSJ-5 TaxID=2965076 RepID=UPI002103BDCC|nr:hypothetical protein [Sporolactobacillus sp. STSJ-5]MCQ2009281.1 hypothetical protein [Sporolactobacillus sp. STSJ-5]
MKHTVKRDHGHYEKSRIEVEDVSEWTFISSALEQSLKETNKGLSRYDTQSDEDSDMINYLTDKKHKLEHMIATLDPKNERTWN